MADPKPILFSEQKVGTHSIGLIQLNRTKAINSLNLDMVKPLYAKLQEWEHRPDIAALVLYSENEKGFCAGGDVKTVVLEINQDNLDYPKAFFKYEYAVDELLSRYSKPVFCWGDGIVMGGGIGLFRASSHRIATDNTVFAMPEVAIGFFPDVGASHFLHEMPQKMGYLLGLSGARFSGADAVHLNMAHTVLASQSKRRFITDILSLKWSDSRDENFKIADSLLERLGFTPTENDLAHAAAEAEKIFSADTLDAALESWKSNENGFLKKAYTGLENGSFHSVQLTWEMLKRSRKWTRKEAAVNEWDMAIHFAKLDDFREGVRALLIDKDKKPNWSSEALKKNELDSFFEPIPENPLRSMI